MKHHPDNRPGDEWRMWADQVDRSSDAVARVAGVFLAVWGVLTVAARLGLAAVCRSCIDWLPVAALALILLAGGLLGAAAVGRHVADRRDRRRPDR